jgi:hypothetical protein
MYQLMKGVQSMTNSEKGKFYLIPAYREWFAECGRFGGQKRSEAKTKACRENIKKAQAVRWAKMGRAVES